jgi:hypothetical protein
MIVNFAKTMLGRGKWQWVFLRADKRARPIDADQGWNTYMKTLPSWVPDPRLVKQQLEGGTRSMESKYSVKLQWNRLFWQICSSHRALAANPSFEDCRGRPIQLAPLQVDFWLEHEGELRSGDIAFSSREKFSKFDTWLVLRPSQLASQTYTLVGVTRPDSPGDDDATQARKFSTCPKIKVRII